MLDLADARPSILIGGTEKPELSAGLARLEINESTEGLRRAEISLGAWGASASGPGLLFMDRKLLEFGAKLEIRRGTLPLFVGRISALDGEFPAVGLPMLHVLAEDRLMDLRRTRRTRTFLDVSDAELFQRLAGDHSLKTKIDLPGPRHTAIAQLNQSDLALLRDRARSLGAELWIEDDTLWASLRPARASSPVKLAWGKGLRAFRAVADLADQVSGVQVSGWDPRAKLATQHRAGPSAIQPELGGDEAGGPIAETCFGSREQSIVHTLPRTGDEAKAEAEATYRHIARRFVCGRGVAEPTAGLRVGAALELSHMGPLFTGRYTVVELRHLFDLEQGLRTEFSVERAGIGRAA